MDSKQKSTILFGIFLVVAIAFAAVAMSQYGHLSKDFRTTEARNLAASLTSATAANYTLRKTKATSGMPIKNCKDVMNILSNRLPAGYEISDQNILPDTVAICTLEGPKNKAIQFSVIGIS